ncbi:MAG TPA: FemAB family XrtA/PEP-CTERM system-associated protein [Planctomycetota bacterium]|nr:FemAB family XrtA/PEP-CTERM system-associated protein [Planctomycetota bacterium]
MTTSVELLDRRQVRPVDRFVLQHPLGTPFHETRWLDLVRASFGFETRTLVAWRDRQVVGVLPLALVTAPITGRRLVSVPFGVYGGILAADDEALAGLDHGSMVLARTINARYLELRYLGTGPTRHQSVALHETYRADLPASPQAVLPAIPRKARAEVRKALERCGVRLVEGRGLLDEFYRLYVLNKRSLGSPVFGRRYFRRLLELYGPRATLHGVVAEQRVLAAVLSVQARDVFYPYYSGAQPGADRLGANNALYALLMEEAVRRGCRVFDFGRSRVGSGAAAFKRHMGFLPAPLDYQFYFPRGGHPPAIHPGNPAMALPQRLLASLPTWLARLVGPAVMRHVP